MTRRPLMHRLARWHIWLGWLVAIPLLLWTVSGVIMVARPIDEVRGEHLRAKPSTIAPGGLVIPMISEPIAKLELISLRGMPHWIATLPDGSKRSYSAFDGSRNPPASSNDAMRIVQDALVHRPLVDEVTYFPAESAPIDLRRARPSWQAKLRDGTHVYVDADTGEVLAVRTPYWRLFDFMWGLHIMDPQAREDTHHPLLVISAVLALVSVLFGTALLFRRRRARRSSREPVDSPAV